MFDADDQPEIEINIPDLSPAEICRLWTEGGPDARRMIHMRHAALEAHWQARYDDPTYDYLCSINSPYRTVWERGGTFDRHPSVKWFSDDEPDWMTDPDD